MADEETGSGNNADDTKDVAESEDGRGVTVESGPEDQLMRFGTITASQPAPLPPDMEREDQIRELDERTADDAAMEVRRREHSSS